MERGHTIRQTSGGRYYGGDATVLAALHDAPNAAASSLVSLAARVVAASAALEDIAAHYIYFPVNVRNLLVINLSDTRLRLLERSLHMIASIKEDAVAAAVSENAGCTASECIDLTGSDSDSDDHDGEYELECQREWEARCQRNGWHISLRTRAPSETHEATAATRPAVASYDARRLYWENLFRLRLRDAANQDELQEARQRMDAGSPSTKTERYAVDGDSLFEDVVLTLKVNPRELVPRSNAAWILRLPLLRRLELHHPVDLARPHGWGINLMTVITQAPSLQELCFFHGRAGSDLLEGITDALMARRRDHCTVTTFEFVSVKLKQDIHHQRLVTLLTRYRAFQRVRISSCLVDFDNAALVKALLAQPKLISISLEHNELDNLAVAAFATARSFLGESSSKSTVENERAVRLPLQHLRLEDNVISAPAMKALATAALDGSMCLKALELQNNIELGDAGIHALTPLLSAEFVPDSTKSTASSLTCLDVSNCHFGLEGAMSLLSALASNHTVVSLNMSRNFVGSGVGDLLADFLLTNDTLQRLTINGVGLGHDGCTPRLLHAFATNHHLVAVAVGANRLRDTAAIALFRSLVARCRSRSYEIVDLSGNLLTVDAIQSILEALTEPTTSKTRKRRRKESGEDDQNVPFTTTTLSSEQRNEKQTRAMQPLIHDLCLLNNDFASNRRRARQLIDSLRRFGGQVRSNEWASQRTVYDDEV